MSYAGNVSDGGKNGKGKGDKGKEDGKQGTPQQAPKYKFSTLGAGESVDVFHRYCQDPNGYFMAQHASAGLLHPSVGVTDGWTTAQITESWDARNYDPGDYKTWVQIQWSHPVWFNRRGHRLDVSKPSMVTQRVMPEQIKQRSKGNVPPVQPQLSLFHVRWGGEQTVNPVTEGAGGWGATGSNPSDNYINTWEDVLFHTLGPTYEIVSAFIQSSEELTKLAPALLRHMLRGKHPVNSQPLQSKLGMRCHLSRMLGHHHRCH